MFKLWKEAKIGFGPMIRVLQTHALPLGYFAEMQTTPTVMILNYKMHFVNSFITFLIINWI